MTASIDEFRARAGRQTLPEHRLNQLRGLIQEAPRAAALTGRPEWDYFLRYIEAQIKIAEAGAIERRTQAARLLLLDEEKAKIAAVAAHVYETRAETLREVILLPKWVIDQGDKAAEAIAKIEEEAQNPDR